MDSAADSTNVWRRNFGHWRRQWTQDLPAAFRHRRNARIFLEFVGGGKAFPLFAEGDEEAGSKHGPSPWQGIKQREVGMVLSALCDGLVEVGNGLQGDPEGRRGRARGGHWGR